MLNRRIFLFVALLFARIAEASALDVSVGVYQEVKGNAYIKNLTESDIIRDAKINLNIISYENEEKIIEDVIEGKIQLALVSVYSFQKNKSKEPLIASVMATYSNYNTTSEIFNTQNSALGEAALAEAAISGIIPLGFWNRGQKGIITKSQIKDLSELKGTKVAAEFTDWGSSFFEQMGASAIQVPQSEIYSALETGAVDAIQIETEMQLIEDKEKIFGGTLLTGFDTGLGMLLANEKFIYEIDEYHRGILKQTINDANTKSQNEYNDFEKTIYQISEENNVFMLKLNKYSDENNLKIMKGIFNEYEKGAEKSELYYYWIRDSNSIKGEEKKEKRGDAEKVNSSEKNIVFVTDRNSYENREFKYQYGPLINREWKYKCGDVEYQNNKNRKQGDPYYGKIYNSSIVVTKYVAECTKFIKEKLMRLKAKELVVYAHGFNNNFESAMRRIIGVSEDIGSKNKLYILWSWPSLGLPGAYKKDEIAIRWSAPHLEELLFNIAKEKPEIGVIVLTHSMGGRIGLRIVERINRDNTENIRAIIFAAPDEDKEVFFDIAKSLEDSGKEVDLYVSKNDRALINSKCCQSYTDRAGLGGNGRLIVPGVSTIDTSNLTPSFTGHSYIFEHSDVIKDLMKIINEKKPAKMRGLQSTDDGQGEYWFMVQ